MRPRLVAAAAALAVAALPTPVSAGGFEYGTDNGAVSVARGGATTAMSTLASMYSNVAGIADAAGSEVYLTANLCMRSVWFQREGFGAVSDETPLFPGPMLAANIRLSDSLVLGLGAFGPAAVGSGHFDHGTREDPGPERYMMTDMDIILVWPTIALGFRAPSLPALRVGIAFQPSFAHVAFTTYAGTVRVDNPDLDIMADLDVWDTFIPAWQIGLLYAIGQWVEVGAQVRLTASMDAEGELTPTEYPFDEETRSAQTPSRARMDAALPFMVFRAGVRYRHPRQAAAADDEEPPRPPEPSYRAELFDIEVDFIYESTSDLEAFVVTLEEPAHLSALGDVAIPPLTIEHHWEDTYGVRLGGSLNLLGGDLTLSAGVWWQSSTVPEAYTHLDFPSWMGVGAGAGVTYRWRWLEVTAAYQHVYMPDRHVSDEEAAIMPLRANAQGGTFSEPPINAGQWRSSLDIVAISFGARL